LGDLQDVPAGGAPDSGSGGGSGRRALRNTALVLAARVASRLLALVTVIVIANPLQPAGLGRFQTVVSTSALVTVLIDLGFNTLFVREAARHPLEMGRYLSNLMSARILFALLALVAFAVALAAA